MMGRRQIRLMTDLGRERSSASAFMFRGGWLLQAGLESDERSIIFVQEPGAKVRRTTAIDDGGADNVAPLA
jgi:hypothetical protein